MIIPWATDAPIYHRPWATLVLMATMIGVFALQLQADDEVVEAYMLSHGDGLHPIQWVTSNFMHAGLMHLVGNLIFLWSFALIVEGKVGFLAFLAVFVGVGTIESAALQVLNLGRDEIGYSLGASGAIYGLIAMTLVWAPKNDLSCLVILGLRVFLFDIPIMSFAFFFIALEAFWVVFQGGELSTELLHFSGAVVGFGLATAMLRLNWVDCEKWDLYSVWGGHAGRDKEKSKKLKKVKLPVFGNEADEEPELAEIGGENLYTPKGKRGGKTAKKKGSGEAVPASADERAEAAATQMRRAIAEGNAAAALAFHDRAAKARASWRPTDADWLGLIQVLAAAKDWSNSVAVMEDYLDRAMKPSHRVRLRLAQVLIREQQRPVHALGVLDAIPEDSLTPDLEATRQKLRLQAEQMRDDGVLELDGKAW